LDTQALGIPDTDYPTTIKMSSSEFVSLCRDLTNLSDCVKIEVKDEECTFSVTGKAGNGKFHLKNNNAERIEDQVTIVNKEDVTCSYGLQCLNSFAKASSLSNVVTLHISAKYPLMIDYQIEDLGFLKFYLAPKMDEEEASNEEKSNN
jgi:proliferating cell nuclear antigen